VKVKSACPHRRRLLHLGVGGGLGVASTLAWAQPSPVSAANPARVSARSLALDHLHTRERLSLVYAQADTYLPPALQSLNHFLRDHHSGLAGQMDPALFDLMHRVHALLRPPRGQAPYLVISGYRAPATNLHLQRTRGGGVATRSLHMEGRAVDVRLPGVPLAELRDAALSLRAGGVGYYPQQQFVHLDTGRVRAW
jgi:uncharacterized protein YcbK (DUF882 family)